LTPSRRATERKTSVNDPLIAVPSGRSLEDFDHGNAPAGLNQLVRRVPIGAQLPARSQLGEHVVKQRQIQLSGLLGGFRTQRCRCQRQAIRVEKKNRFRHLYLSSSEESLLERVLDGSLFFPAYRFARMSVKDREIPGYPHFAALPLPDIG
jgi:hypothetical protein